MNENEQILPQHIAVIMDGNGRWAESRGLTRQEGHLEGAENVRRTIEHCVEIGIRYLTLYTFSTENWSRPRAEVEFIMQQLATYLAGNRDEMKEEGVRFRAIGCINALPSRVRDEIRETEELTGSGSRLHLLMAVNYGAHAEITRACRLVAQEVAGGRLPADGIDEEVVSSRLYTAGIPAPDLLIRTGGEMRLSNFLLWQLSYSEIYFTKTLWPDFKKPQLHAALSEYARRERRYGRLQE